MRRLAAGLAILILTAGSTWGGNGDRVLSGGSIVTAAGTRRAAVLVRDGLVAGLLTPAEGARLAAQGLAETRLDGAFVLPGLADAHLHLTGYGAALEQADLTRAASWKEVVKRARRAAVGLPRGAWLLGRGWDQNLWPDRRMPDRAELDNVFPQRPVLLRRVDGHAAVANAVALELAGIGRETKDPPGGSILRRPGGDPTGVLVDGAVGLVQRFIPAPTEADIERWIVRSAGALLAVGLTQVHDAGTTAAELEVLRRLESEGRLPIRVYVLLDGSDDALLDAELPRGPELGPARMLRIGGVKLYADGALGSRGAFLGADYADDPGNRGLQVTPTARLRKIVHWSSEAGFQVAIHAIGDQAVHRALDLYEELGARTCRRLRHRIEHSQTVRPDDVKRFGELGVIAAVQPTHCTSDMPWAPSRLGPDRIAWAYRWRSLLEVGTVLAGGSDAPVEDPDPRRGLFAAVTRQRPDHSPAAGWNPAERVTPREALAMFTTGAAFAAHAEGWCGTLLPGAVADLTIVDRDPTAASPDDVLRMRVLRTIVAGRDRWTVAALAGAGGRP